MTTPTPRPTDASNIDVMASLKTLAAQVDTALDALLPPASEGPGAIHEAMRYVIAAGGKRIRPALALAAAEAVGAPMDHALPVACAVELIHTYSLVHDDLPAMDDDALRRGKPTCHIVWDEATAVLTGDALLTHAFEALADDALAQRLGIKAYVTLVREIAVAAGSRGMVGGQILDMASEGKDISLETLTQLHAMKTGALLKISVVAGARAAGADAETLEALGRWGDAVGLAFQIVDDVLDVTSDTETLGKPQGSDIGNDKGTFPSIMGLEASQARAEALVAEAHAALTGLGDRANLLKALGDFVVRREA